MDDDARRRRIVLFASLGISLLGCVILLIHVKRIEREVAGGERVSLLSLRQDVEAGRPLAEDLLIAHEVPQRYADSRQVLAEDMPRILGVPVAIDLEANQTLAWTDLATTPRRVSALAERIPRGMRAISIEPSDRRPLGGLLRPGDRVDVLHTRVALESKTRAVTAPIVQNVLVLAVGSRMHVTRELERADSSGLVTLLVTIEQAGLLAHAKRDGPLGLVLRNHLDLELEQRWRPTRDEDVVQSETATHRAQRTALERLE